MKPTKRNKGSLLILTCLSLIQFGIVSCEKPAAPTTARPQTIENLQQAELADPQNLADPRQNSEGIQRQLREQAKRITDLEKTGGMPESQKKELEKILSEMTSAMESLDRRCGELERESQTLRSMLNASKSGGFQK